MPLWNLFLMGLVLPPDPPAISEPAPCPTPPDYTYSDWYMYWDEHQFKDQWVIQYLHYSRTRWDECRGTSKRQTKVMGPYTLWPAVPENRVADVSRPQGPTEGVSGSPLRSSTLPGGGAPGAVGPVATVPAGQPRTVPLNPVPPGPQPFFPGVALFVGALVAAWIFRPRKVKVDPVPAHDVDPVQGPPVPRPEARTLDSIKKGDEWVPTPVEVEWLQAFFGIEETGYGPLTQEAVKKIQREHGIEPDTLVMVGPNTYRALWAEHLDVLDQHWKRRAEGRSAPTLDRIFDSPMPPDLRDEMMKRQEAYAAYWAAVEGRYEAIQARNVALVEMFDEEIKTLKGSGIKLDEILVLREKYEPLGSAFAGAPSLGRTQGIRTAGQDRLNLGEAPRPEVSTRPTMPNPSSPYGYSIEVYRNQWCNVDAALATPGVLNSMEAVLRHEGDSGMLQVTPGNLRSMGGDAQGASLGALQWNFGQGTLQPLLRDFKKLNPDAWGRYFKAATFGEDGEFTIESLMQRTEDSSDWDDIVQALHKPGSNKLVDSMAVAFGNLAQDSEWHKVQAKFMGQNEYLPHAMEWAQQFGLESERGLALMLDIAVQNGAYWFQTGSGSPNDHAQEVLAALNGNMDEEERIQAVYEVYEHQLIGGKYSPDGERRRRSIAAGGVVRNGSGFGSLSTSVPWRGGTSAETASDAGGVKVQWDVPMLKQDDGGVAWGELRMAPKTVKTAKSATVANYGCALTSAAMALRYLGIDTDPKDIIERATWNDANYPKEVEDHKTLGLASVWNLYWYLLGAEYPGVTTRNSEYKDLEQIRDWLAKGPVILGGSGSDGPHFVVITGYTGSGENSTDFLINDPGKARTTLADFLEDYPTAETIVQYGK